LRESPDLGVPWQSTGMDDSDYLACLSSDYGHLRDAAAAADLAAPVPGCPGWTMADLVSHVAVVYLHKVTVMRTGEWPEQWPPPGLADEAPVPLLEQGYGQLMAEFSSREPAAPAPSWYDPDQTVAFWIRRMAQETVMHRIDAEQAAELPVTPVSANLAVDGVDEVLRVFLSYVSASYPEEFAQVKGGHLAGQDGQDTITVAAGPVAWTVRPAPRGVLIFDGAADAPRVTIEAAPDPMLRWLWGRAGDDQVRMTGDQAWADYLRRILADVTE
jgi:uncharacterized protein (TIGR03083 family)